MHSHLPHIMTAYMYKNIVHCIHCTTVRPYKINNLFLILLFFKNWVGRRFLFYSVLVVVPINSRLQYRDQLLSHLPVLLTPKISLLGMSSRFKAINDE